jgi:hypothetical protein
MAKFGQASLDDPVQVVELDELLVPDLLDPRPDFLHLSSTTCSAKPVVLHVVSDGQSKDTDAGYEGRYDKSLINATPN